MSASTSVTQNPPKNFLNDIQHKIYSVHEKIFGLCSTDSKIYAFLILGRVLQTVALISFAVSIAFTFTVGPIALLGVIPAFALGVLGTYIAGNPEELNDLLLAARPFVAGQPVGLVNEGNNCWLNSSLQLMANTPAFHPRMRQIPQLSQFLDAYEKNRTDFQKVAANIDIQGIRQILSRETSGQIVDGSVQEDAAQFFEYIFQGPDAIHQFDQKTNGGAPVLRRESMLQIGLGESPRPNFQQLFNAYFDQRTDTGQRVQLSFQRPPNDLLVQARRFYQQMDASGTLQQGKIVEAIDIPERLALANQFAHGGADSEYVCDAFSIHNGASSESGHYTSYVKRQGTWWYCSDTRVYEVAATTALHAMKYGYIFHYAKASP